MFSALALAIAAFARSTKEGQYYLMPLLLISLPLMILPMLPAVSLNLGTSLIPITGMMLLLRAVVEGQYAEAALFAPPVLLVTGGCCLLAIRWAVDQFNNESVLFRESERVDLGLWLRHLVRDRGPTPTFGQAMACGVMLLTIRFFATFAAKTPDGVAANSRCMQFVTLAVLVALPGPDHDRRAHAQSARDAVARTAPAARRCCWPRCWRSRCTRWPCGSPRASSGCIRSTNGCSRRCRTCSEIIASAPSIWHILALMALVPAICEELAFRGFILSGLRHMGTSGEPS